MTAAELLTEDDALFFEQSRGALLKAVEDDLCEHVMNVGQAFTHLLKDELELILPALVDLCLVRKQELSDMLKNGAIDLLNATEQRLGDTFDLDELCLEWSSFNIVTPDERVINNFVRELPCEASKVFRDLLLPKIDMAMDVPAEVCRERVFDAFRSSWREVLTSKDTYEVTTYNREKVGDCLDQLQEKIHTYVKGYREEVADCITAQQGELDSITRHRDELNTQKEQIRVPIEELRHVIGVVRDTIHWDYEDALAAAKEEVQLRTSQDERSLDGT